MGSKPNVCVRPRRDAAAAAARAVAVRPHRLTVPAVRALDLEPVRVRVLDVLGGELHGLEEAGALVEHLVRLVVRLVGDLEHLVDGLLGHDRSHDRLDVFALVEHHAVLLRKRAREVDAREEAFRDEDLAELAPAMALLLPGKGLVQLLPRQEPFLDEELPERAPHRRRGRGGLRLRLRRRLDLDAVLLGERAGERERGDRAGLDEDLADEPAAPLLLGQRPLELVLGQQAFRHEERSKRLPGIRGIHLSPYRPQRRRNSSAKGPSRRLSVATAAVRLWTPSFS